MFFFVSQFGRVTDIGASLGRVDSLEVLTPIECSMAVIDVTIQLAYWGEESRFGGYFDLRDHGLQASTRYRFRALRTDSEERAYQFTELAIAPETVTTPVNRPTNDERAHLLFATALDRAIVTLGEHDLKKRVAAGTLLSVVPAPAFSVSDIGVTISMEFDPAMADLEEL